MRSPQFSVDPDYSNTAAIKTMMMMASSFIHRNIQNTKITPLVGERLRKKVSRNAHDFLFAKKVTEKPKHPPVFWGRSTLSGIIRYLLISVYLSCIRCPLSTVPHRAILRASSVKHRHQTFDPSYQQDTGTSSESLSRFPVQVPRQET